MSLFSSRRPPRRHPSTSWLVDLLPQFFDRVLRRVRSGYLKLFILLLLVLSIPLIVTPLKIWQQGMVALMLIITSQIVVRAEEAATDTEQQVSIIPKSEYFHLFMVWLSVVTTLRYLYYRTSYTLNFDTWINGISCLLLYGAELYAVLTLFLSFFQTLKIKERQAVDLSNLPQNQWFKVDIYIPTYNEDIEIVRKTTLGAIAIDYPADKKRVYVLDDGRKFPERREQLRQMCQDLGCTLLTRPSNEHAKAGNINTALQQTDGELILIFDCDHIPTRQFLQHTVGFFLNPKVSFVQTPHWFYNPDPFERNLLTAGRVPVGNELFYKVLQKGNDFWNAAFFCGSAAVIRRTHLLEVGGIAVETVTEDCHTALRLHSLGYESVYYDKIMIAGLAPEKFSAYIGQQVRWARGMAQILRLENPMFNWKLNLTIPQRICYLSATSHFFYGFPRLMYAIAPTLFLLFGINPIQGLGLETLAYALPHLVLGLSTNYITYKHVRFSFWNEVFEFVLAFQTGYVTLMALINPKLGKFNVTDKGQVVTKRSFDWESARGLLAVAALVFASLLSVPFWLLLRPEDSQAVLVNALWCIFNLVLLMAALLVAFEQPQLRRTHRLDRRLTATIRGFDQTWTGRTIDVSETGARITLETLANLPDEVEVELVGDYGRRAFLNARIIREPSVSETQTHLVMEFTNPNRTQMDNLALVLYSDVQEWYSQKREFVDRPLASWRFLANSLVRSLRDPQAEKGSSLHVRKHISATAQLYWEGHFYPGEATELGGSSLRLELDNNAIPAAKRLEQHELEKMQREKPTVGLLLSQQATDPLPVRLLAQISAVELPPVSESDSLGRIALELKFPEHFKQQQGARIKQLLREL